MADGNVFELVDRLFRPVQAVLDDLFYAGVLYGASRLTFLLRDIIRGVRTYFVPLGNYSKRDLSKTFGKWVVITCGTSGIGLAFAHEFARRRMNVVLISSSYDDLVAIVSELQTLHNVVAYGIHADFSLGPKVFQEIHDVLNDFEVGILVNNQGARYDHPQYFALVPHRSMWELMDVNVVAPTVMTHMLLPQMAERGRGAIINVCSVAAVSPPTPLLTEYTAASAYLNNFSRALEYENQHKGIIVQTLLPCGVAASNASKSTLLTPTPTTYVKHALATLGVASQTSGYWPHALQRWCGSFVPDWMWVKAVLYNHTRTRKEIKAARERNQEQQFTRRRHYIPQNYERARYNSTESRISDLSFRRTPSPQRKISTIEPPGSPKALKKMSTTSAPFLDHHQGTDLTTPNRPLSAGLQPQTRQNPRTSTPLEVGGIPSLGAGGAAPIPGGLWFNSSSVRRISNSSTVLPPEHSGRTTSAAKVSRVLVIPSLARVSHHPDVYSRSRPGSPQTHTPTEQTPSELADTHKLRLADLAS